MPKKESNKTVRDVLRVAYRHRPVFLGGFFIAAFSVLVLTHWYPPLRYSGTAKFERRQKTGAEQVANAAAFSKLKSTLRYHLAGTPALERAVVQLGWDEGMPRDNETKTLTPEGTAKMQALVSAIQSDLRIRWQTRTQSVDVVDVTYECGDPNRAAELPNLLVENYIEWVSSTIIGELRSTLADIEREYEEARAALEVAERERERFEIEHAGRLPDKPASAHAQIGILRKDIEELEGQARLTRRRLQRSEAMLEAPKTDPNDPREPDMVVYGPNPEMARLLDTRDALHDQLEVMVEVGGMKEAHPDVREKRKQLALVEKRIEETPETVVTETHYSRRDQQSFLLSEIADAKASLEQLALDLQRREQQLAKWTDVVRDQEAWNKYQRMQSREQELREDKRRAKDSMEKVNKQLRDEAAMKATRLRAIQTAEPRYRPSSPSLSKILGMALMAGVGLGGALVLLLMTLDRSITTVEDANKLFDVPIIGVTSEIVSGHQRRMRRLKAWTVQPLLLVTMIALLGVAGFSNYLRLRRPSQYGKWKSDPVGFIQHEYVEPVWTRVSRRAM
jgi:uncharacterized protein involved in exopolysaccharide biosynthesis